MLTTREVALRFGVSKTAVQQWGRQGLIRQCYQDEFEARALAAAA
jgi:DNA-binding transcriptional MerR regulator